MSNNKKSDTTVLSLKIAKIITILVYIFTITAVVFLSISFVLQLFGANYSTPFVQFMYKGAYEFLQPFRGIFPGHQVSDTSYFNASALFAVVIYLVIALALHSLISYLSTKLAAHQKELQEYQEEK